MLRNRVSINVSIIITAAYSSLLYKTYIQNKITRSLFREIFFSHAQRALGFFFL